MKIIIFVACLLIGGSEAATTIEKLEPHYGSSNGATTITVSGSEFATDSFNAFDANLGNTVYLVSDTKEYECVVDKDATDEDTITCYTVAMEEGTYHIKLKVDGNDISDSGYCGGNQKSYGCSFTVVWWRTPLIWGISPESGYPQQVFTITGRIFTDKFRTSDSVSSNGIDDTLRRVWFTGGLQCELFQNLDDKYGVELAYNEETDTYGNTGYFKCGLNGKFISAMNASFIIDGDYGRSKQLAPAFKVSANYKLYMFQSYAGISSVKPSDGSTHGGTKLEIAGTYLNDESTQVIVGGDECEIIDKTDDLVTCVTSGDADLKFQNLFPGSRGVIAEVYEGLEDASGLGESYDDYIGSKRKFLSDNSAIKFTATSSPVVIRVRGFFLPATDGTYLFTSSKAGKTEIYLSTDSTEDNKVLVSGSASLTKGTYYYYEMIHTESTTEVDVTMQAYLKETQYNYNQTSMARPERQNISTTSIDNHEIQDVTLTGWDPVANPTKEQFTLCITCLLTDSCGSEEYYFLLHGVQTEFLLSSGSTDEIKRWIEHLPTMHGDTVTVIKNTESDNCFSEYTIEVDAARGHIPFEAKAVDSSIIDVQLSIVEQPQASRTSFTLAFDGVPSSHALVGDPSSVADAVKSLFTPNCPAKLAQPGSPWLSIDFESGEMNANFNESSGEIVSEDSYCGFRSLKDPTSLIIVPTINNNIDEKSQFCMAFKGTGSIVVKIFYFYATLDGLAKDGVFDYNYVGTSSWQHVCENLFDNLKILDGFQFRLANMTITAEESDNDVFIDDIFVGTVELSDMKTLRTMRKLPQTTIKLQDVTVAISESTYTITMKAHDCRTGIPLLQAAYGTRSGGVYTASSWGTASISIGRLQSAAPEIGGSFSVTLPPTDSTNGGTVSDIPWNVEASTMEDYLESIPGVTDVTVTREGSCRAYNWTVVFESPAGDHEMLVATGSFTNPDAEIKTTLISNGGLYLDTIPGDWLRPAYSVPQVEIIINDIPSICSENQCSFQHKEASTPTVTFAEISGSTLTISGSKFSDTLEDNTVIIGGTNCVVTSSAESDIQCTMQNPPSGSQKLMVNVATLGDSNEYPIDISTIVDAIDPTSGSTAGGTRLTISGFGFSEDTQISLGGTATCVTSSVTYSEIVCTTSSNEAGLVDVTVSDSTLSGAFTFENTAASGSVSPSTLSVLGGELTISGSGFGESSDDNVVYVGTKMATILGWSDTFITVTAPSMAADTYQVNVYIHPEGYADLSAGNSVEYELGLTAASPTASSLMGGLELTITGYGFDGDVEVSVGDLPCFVETLSQTSVTCLTGSSGVTHSVGVNGEGYAWEPQTLTIKAGDSVKWTWSQIAGVTGASYQVFTTSSALSQTYDGNGFHSGPQIPQGAFEYQFAEAGTYHYGGFVDSTGSNFMSGIITVVDAPVASHPVSLKVNGHEAIYPNGAMEVLYMKDSTPTITMISPTSGTSEQVITIEGSGFSDIIADNLVTIGDSNCVVSAATSSQITCQIAADAQPVIGRYLEVKVKVAEKGYSLNEIRSYESRHFVVFPHVSSFTPTAGSLFGGTKITILGGGLTDLVSVKIGGETCHVTSSSEYGSVSCTTSAAPEGSYDIEAIVDGIQGSAICTSSCSFSYSSSATITAHSVDPMDIVGTTTVTIGWNGQATDTAVVKFGSALCAVTDTTDSYIKCTVDGLTHGTYDISVDVAGKGIADSSLQVTSPAFVTSITPSSGSVNGFTTVTITGNGFDVDNVAVTIGSQPCQVKSATTTVIKCITAALENEGSYPVILLGFDSNVIYEYVTANTPEVTAVSPSEASPDDTIAIAVTVSPYTTQPTVEFGGVPCVVSDATEDSILCTLGNRYGGGADISVIFPDFGKANVAAGVSFSYGFGITEISPLTGSLGGGQSLTITGYGFSEESTVTICDLVATVISPSSTSLTVLTPAHDAGECQIIVTNPGATPFTYDTAFQYDPALTPEVISVSPTSGGTGGGTVLTITGTKLELVEKVVIDGVECGSLSVTDTGEITCKTNSHVGSKLAPIQCFTASGGLASGDVDFFYVDRWSSEFTWGGDPVPQDGEFVTIGEGQTVLLDTTTNKLKMLLIQGGQVIFENDGFVHLQAEHILIASGGLLQIGTEDEEYTANAEITMIGNLHSTELPIYGAKTLGIREGRLEMHGKHINDPWALLDTTAMQGSNQITLSIPVSWSPGDKIVIASTGHRHSQIENEEKVISTIDVTADGKTVITLTEDLEYEHLGVTETYTDANGNTHEYDYRAEVGLLTRNIVFRGSEDLSWNENIPKCPDGFDTGMFVTQTCFQGRFGEEAGSDQFGASIMIHSKSPNTDPNNAKAQAHIEYVELTYVGQAFKLGRYPIHWHLMGDMTGNYVRGCSIHRTFNRAVTIHNTHNLLVERNVIYNVMGGAFFIEDGIETGNTIQYNLAVFVRQSTSLLNDDITPAAYWVTNPNNTIQHNHAAGGTHFGFWYRMHKNPDGPSFDPNICQQNYELGIFRNNSAHTQGWFGLWIFQVYLPREGSGCDSVRPMAAKFYSLTSWHCEKGAEWVEGGAIQFINFKLASNEDSAIDIKLIFGTEWSKEDRGALIKDNLIVGRANFEDASVEGKYGIVLPFAPGLWIDGVTFVNFAETDHTAFFVTHISGTCTVLCGGWHYRVQNLVFINTNTRIMWRWEHEGVIDDLDGSFTGEMVASKVVPSSEIYKDGTQCMDMDGLAFSPSGAYKSMKCSVDVNFHRIAFNDIQPTSLRYKNATLTRSDGDQYFTKSYFAKKRLTHAEGYMMLVPGGYTYKLAFEEGGTFINMSYNAKFYDMYDGDYIIITHEMPQAPSRASVCGGANEDCEFFKPENITTAITPTSSNRQWHYDELEGVFSYIVTRKTSSRKRRGSMSWQQMEGSDLDNYVVRPIVERCLYENCIVPVGGTSLPDVFESDENAVTVDSFDHIDPCFEVEGTGDEIDVTIPDGCWIKWAIPTGTVRTLTVEGNLEFVDGLDISLTATYIVVKGRFIAGFNAGNPRQSRLDITLQGTPTTMEKVASSGVVLGSKVLACHGTCDLHGKGVSVSWTKLSTTAAVGSNTIVLSQAVPWQINDEIVIAPTGFNAWRTEKRIITAISADKKTLTLDNPLLYEHKSEIHNYESGWTIDFSAEVGLLSRSITISGDESADSYGPRVIVTTTEAQYTAKGRFSNVEFVRTGQEGFYDDYDPRHSLAFKNAGTLSQVRNCAFHDGYATAIGTYGTDQVEITGNVIHHTVNEGIVIKGFGHELSNNLVVLNIFRGSYKDRMETTNYDYTAAINIETATQLKMTGNVVAGAERVAYRISGQSCESTDAQLWSGNVGHATLLGTAHMKTALQGCTLVHGFILYNVWDFAIYHQTTDSVIIRNCAVVDATVGYMPLIAGPDPLTHAAAEKSATVKNSLFVARRDPTDCDVDLSEETEHSLIIRRMAGVDKKAPSTPSGGRTGVMLALFEGGYNGATFKALHVNMNYPALYGLLRLEDVTFANFKQSCSSTDAIFFTNPINEDVFHPTHLSGIVLDNCEKGSYVFIDKPNVKNINPSDCVDMQCDAKLKVLINDEDGSFLGSIGSIISQSERDWGDQTLGLGDYRIPKPLLAATDGTKQQVDDVVPLKGIARKGSSCALNDEWQGYQCTGDTYQYRMMVIESLDSDTETRRLSPVAVKVEDTIDLVNGPQDHGWCSGYTCQKRISTFYTIVPEGKLIDIYFTSTPPLNMKFHLINSPSTERVTVAIWIPTPQRLNVLVNKVLIPPSNRNGDRLEKPPASNLNFYKPDPASCEAGDNYLDLDERKLYICLVGGSPVEIETKPAIILNMMFPAITLDQFFDENLEANLASVLGIDVDDIRRVNVVPEQSRRRRSAEVEVSVELQANSQDDAVVLYDKAIEAVQNGEIIVSDQKAIRVMIGGTQTEEDIAAMDTKLRNGETVVAQTEVRIPAKISATTTPTGEELSSLSVAPVVQILDESDVVVTLVANSYQVSVALDTTGVDADSNAVLSGTTTLSFSEGVATFSDLNISHSGTYNLIFSISAHDNIADLIVSVVVQERSICADINGLLNSELATDGDDLQYQLQLTDCASNNLQNLDHKSYTYKIDVSFDDSSLYGTTSVAGTKTFTFDSTGALTTTGLSLSSTNKYNVYNLKFRLYTDPASSYDKSVGVKTVQIYPSDAAEYLHDASKQESIKLTFSEKYDAVVGNTYTSKAIETGLYNDMVKQFPDLYFGVFTVTSDSDGNLQIHTTVKTKNETVLENFYKNFDATGSLDVGTQSVTVRASCSIEISGNCYQATDPVNENSDSNTTVIVFAILGACVALSIIIITATYLIKRQSLSKVNAMRCMDGSPNSLRPLHDVENEISWSRTSSPGYMEHSMTPVGK